MNRLLLLSILLMAVYTPPSTARVQWRGDYDEALREAKRRNVPLLLVFLQDGVTSAAAVALASYLNQQVVPLIAHQEAAHGSKKRRVFDRETGKLVEKNRCNLYPTIACADHSKVYLRMWQTGGEFSKNNTVPACYVLDPAGKILAGPKQQLDAAKSGSVKAALEKVRKKLGLGVPMRLYAAVSKTVDQARRSAKQGKAARGIAAIRKWMTRLAKRKLPSLVAGLKEDLSDIDMQGHLLLDQAEQETDAGKARALRLLVQKEFAGLESGDEATKALNKK